MDSERVGGGDDPGTHFFFFLSKHLKKNTDPFVIGGGHWPLALYVVWGKKKKMSTYVKTLYYFNNELNSSINYGKMVSTSIPSHCF